jgi:type II secretory pathway predicted ATPase ExeA
VVFDKKEEHWNGRTAKEKEDVMKIGELDQHCGDCTIIDLCGEPFSEVCLCGRDELKDSDESTYRCVAERIQSVNKHHISNRKMCDRICRDIRIEKTKRRMEGR